MPNELMLAVGLLTALALWMTLQHAWVMRQTLRQRRIAEVGVCCQGRVVAIQRPFMLDDCTRLYFDFVPVGAEEPVRGCHIARGSQDEPGRPLPSQGTLVTVRYLPAQPRLALIAM